MTTFGDYRENMDKMRSVKGFLIFIMIVTLISSCSQQNNESNKSGYADLVFQNGSIYTVDENRSWAEAIAIKNGIITFVGNNTRAKDFIGPDTTTVNLEQRMVLPGMHDVHIHPISGGVLSASCDLNGLSTIAQYRSAILNYANANPDVEWILGGGWAMSVFGAGGKPSRKIIDELIPDRPVYLRSTDGHSGWANSIALEMAGLTKDTPDPIDGIIDRDPETGELIGSLQEGAMNLVERVIPPTTIESKIAGLKYSIKMLNGYGITSIQDAIVRESDLKTYQSLEQNKQLSLRVVASLWWERDQGLEQIPHLIELRKNYSSELVSPTTVKIMQDGLVENYTAVLVDHYHNVPGPTKGIPMIEPEFLKGSGYRSRRIGLSIAFSCAWRWGCKTEFGCC